MLNNLAADVITLTMAGNGIKHGPSFDDFEEHPVRTFAAAWLFNSAIFCKAGSKLPVFQDFVSIRNRPGH